MRAMPTNAAQISIFATGNPVVILGMAWTFSVNGTLGRLRVGRSAIKRPAIPLESAGVHRPPGSRTISVANRSVAASLGSSDNSAASFQGWRFNRASAERTLSGISSLSMPIGA